MVVHLPQASQGPENVRDDKTNQRMTYLLQTLLLFNFTAVSGVELTPALATCESSQVLLAGVSGVFSRGSPVFAPLLIGPSHMS